MAILQFYSGSESQKGRHDMLKAATRSTLHEDILAQLCGAIERGEWTSGSRLPSEQCLALQLGVSRNCIREVMKVLANRRVVESRPGRGTFLAENAGALLQGARQREYIFGNVNFSELIEVRCLVEGQIAYYAAERGTDEELAELEILLTSDIPDVARAHVRFHARLARIARHRLLERLLDSIHNEISIQREHYLKWRGRAMDELTRNHLEILRRVRDRDARGARDAMVEHISSVWTDLFGVPLNLHS
jgi:GntR family transcriptional repressor for pyruvate dehydrogenase complex